MELFYTVGGHVNGAASMEKSLSAPQELNHNRIVILPSNSIPRHIGPKLKKRTDRGESSEDRKGR